MAELVVSKVIYSVTRIDRFRSEYGNGISHEHISIVDNCISSRLPTEEA
jgi:hypothetical protein